MAHAQKPDVVFRRNGRVYLNRPGASVQSTTVSRGVRFSGSNAGYTMFRGSVKSTGYPLHSPVFPSLPLQCLTVCHHFSTGLYQLCMRRLGGTTLPFWTSVENLALTGIVSRDRAARKTPLLYPVPHWSLLATLKMFGEKNS